MRLLSNTVNQLRNNSIFYVIALPITVMVCTQSAFWKPLSCSGVPVGGHPARVFSPPLSNQASKCHSGKSSISHRRQLVTLLFRGRGSQRWCNFLRLFKHHYANKQLVTTPEFVWKLILSTGLCLQPWNHLGFLSTVWGKQYHTLYSRREGISQLWHSERAYKSRLC